MNRYISLSLIILILTCSISAISINDIKQKAYDLYLINPLDSNDNAQIFDNSKVYCDDLYWVLKADDGYIFISDSNPEQMVTKDKADQIVKSIDYYSNINSQSFDIESQNYFDSLSRSFEDTAYKIDLIRMDINDPISDNLNAYSSILNSPKSDLNNIIKSIGDIRYELINKNNCSSIQSIYSKATTLSQNLDSASSKIDAIQKSLDNIKKSIYDSNLDSQAKISLNDLVSYIDSPISGFQNYKGKIKASIEQINVILNSNQFSNELIVQRFEDRKLRAIFLKNFLSEDKEIKSKVNKVNAKELFELISYNKNLWSDQTQIISFETNYDQMLDLYKKGDYINAQNKIQLLKKQGLDIYSLGYRSNQSLPEESANQPWYQKYLNYTMLMYIGIALLGLIIVIKIAQKIKDTAIENKDDSDSEIDIKI